MPASLDAPSTLKESGDGETAFPRGGASALTPLEHKQVASEAMEDALFESAEGANVAGGAPKTKVKGKRNDAKREKETGPRVEGLSYKRLTPGSLVLGCVQKINRLDIALSLPNNLTGFVPITQISNQITSRIEALVKPGKADSSGDDDSNDSNDSDDSDDHDDDGDCCGGNADCDNGAGGSGCDQDDGDDGDDGEVELTSMFKVGQYLRAYVLHSTEEVMVAAAVAAPRIKKRIELSLEPKLANASLSAPDLCTGCTVQASVVSVEDHGLVMDLGLGDPGLKGFLSSRELGNSLSLLEAKEGQVLLCTVTGLSANRQVAQLSTDLEQRFTDKGKLQTGKPSWWLSQASSIHAFLPGTGAEVLVARVGRNGGIAGSIMGMLDAVADYFHVAGWDPKALEERVKAGSKIKARITTLLPPSSSDSPKKVGFSILPHVLSFAAPPETDPLAVHPIASIIECAEVVGVEPRIGLFLDMGVPGTLGFVHISRISSEEKLETLEESTGAYRIGTAHPARVLGFNRMDRLFVLSMENRILQQPYLSIDDIPIGQLVKGRIEKVLDRGGLLLDLGGVRGVVEETHLSDLVLKNPEKKFREGMHVMARVLSSNPKRRKLHLTLKKSLVNSELPIISSYNVEPGTQAVGTLVHILPHGAVMKFYAGVSAFLPVSEMSEAYIRDPAEHFRVGQAIRVHVLVAHSGEKKMRVSCKDPSTFGSVQEEALANLKIGQVVSGKISEKANDGIVVQLEGGVGAAGLKGIIPVGHLTDGIHRNNTSKLRTLGVGQTLSELVVIDKNKGRMIRLSAKPSLISAAKQNSLIYRFGQLSEGAITRGFVKNITEVGVFVGFAGGIVGLASKNALPLEKQSLPDFGYFKDQSVTGRVFAMNYPGKKFLLSLKPIEVKKPPADGDGDDGVPNKTQAREVINPVDGRSQTIDEYTTGKISTARVTSVQTSQINVQLADNIQGRIDVSQVFDNWADIKNKKAPLTAFKKGDLLVVKVIGLHNARSHRFLPISHRISSNRTVIFELSAKPSVVNSDGCDLLRLDRVLVGSTWLAFVNNILDDCIWLHISTGVRGRMRLLDISADVVKLQNLPAHFPIGSALRCTAVGVDAANEKLDLSARRIETGQPAFTLDSLSRGMVVPGRVTKVLDHQVLVQLSDTVVGSLYLIDVADDFARASISSFQQNHVLRVYVRDVDKSNGRVSLSSRPSRVLNSDLPVTDPEVHSIRDVKDGELRRGFVRAVTDKGLFVTLGHNVTAWVKVCDLADTFLKEWKANFPVHQVVEGRVVAANYSLGHVQMSLRRSAISGKTPEGQAGLEDFTKGQTVSGKIKKIVDYGVFIAIDGSEVSGLCHVSQIADRKIEDISKLYAEGDPVKAKILSIDMEKRRISFGIKASCFSGSDTNGGEDGGGSMDLDLGSDGDDEDEDEDEDSSTDGEDGGGSMDLDLGSDGDNEDEDEDEDSSTDGGVDLSLTGEIHRGDECGDVSDAGEGGATGGGLSTGGFDWTASNIFEKREREVSSDSGSDSDDGEGGGGGGGEKRGERKKKKRRLGEIKQDRTGDLVSREPKSITDFERLTLGDPNDSKLWIRYMAFQLQLGELEKAREIAERALKTIDPKEDSERRNAWVASLNMENAYGSDDTLEAVFQRAVQYNDAQDIHERMASIYIQSGKFEKADGLFKVMVKKFNKAPRVWVNYADFLLTHNNRVAARELLKRALQSLPRDQHRDLIIRFASLEFRTGEPERGRTLFENLIGAYNKRMDIWNVFIDMEMKHAGKPDGVRVLFKRAVADEKCSPKQAAALFKKWRGFEEKMEDGEGANEVMDRARAYVLAAKEEKERTPKV